MRVYNTLSGEKEDLVPGNPPEIKMYVCGPTTYNYIHLGNARPLVVFDTVRRYLEFRGYKVSYVQNFTDVDDKIIKRAQEEGCDPLELAQRYIDAYFVDADHLGILRADQHPRVSDHMPQIIEAVAGLIEKGHAYPIEGDVYYRVMSFPAYGKLSGRSLDDMLAGARVGVDERKEDPMDFALWKTAKPGEPSWDSPWGPGRPGWHIECSVMSTFYLGNTLDIHGGGADLIFPHHENEIAQAEGLTGEPFCRYWIHNGFITVNNEKMSKSLGNFFILRDILDKYPADVVRFYLIATHYRSPLDFDDGKLVEARRALGRLKNTRILAREFLQTSTEEASPSGDERDDEFLKEILALEGQFIEAMDDDFNSAWAMGHLFEMAHSINSFLAKADCRNPGSHEALGRSLDIYETLAAVMGLFQQQEEKQAEVEKILQVMSELRARARQNKEFPLADQIRDFMLSLGVKAEDSLEKTRFRYEAAPAIEDLVEECIRLRAVFKGQKNYPEADFIRDRLLQEGIALEDTREGVRWKFA
ncbi:MAG TPA: cysteine--tRNA ligase [Syntrophomonadaceae bacterium]|nr:cysteine--tRNA ligase [Syntrophomonadaceae bacterium]